MIKKQSKEQSWLRAVDLIGTINVCNSHSTVGAKNTIQTVFREFYCVWRGVDFCMKY